MSTSGYWHRLCIAACLLALVTTLVAAHAGHDHSPAGDDPGADMRGVEKLTSDTFWETVGKDKGVFVEFYAPWCGHCKHMAAEYAKLGGAIHASPKSQEKLIVAKVDGSEHRSISGRVGVSGFPTLLYFPPGSTQPTKYEKARTAEAMIDFLKEQIPTLDLFIPKEPQYVEEVDASTYDDAVTENTNTNILVLFYAPWCGHCKAVKPVLNEVARIFQNEERVRIVQVNADAPQNKALADKLGVKGFPTIFFYEFAGRSLPPEEYAGPRTVEGFVTFINERAYTMRKADGDVNEDYGLIDVLTQSLNDMIVAGDDAAKMATAYESFLNYGKGLRGENVIYYTKLARRMKEDGNAAFLDTELARLERILAKGGSGGSAGVRRDNMMRRRNIIAATKARRMLAPMDVRRHADRTAAAEQRYPEGKRRE